LVKVIVLGVIKPCTCSYTRTLRFLYPVVTPILTHSVNLAFGLNRASKTNVELGPDLGLWFRARAGFGLQNHARLQLWAEQLYFGTVWQRK